MDNITFLTQNNEYIVELNKHKKSFCYSKYGQYECHIIFKNFTNQPILDIKCTEKDIVSAINVINMFSINIGSELDDIIHFENNGDLRNYFWYIATLNTLPFYPVEEDPKIQISIFEDYIGKRALRLYLEMNYEYLEILVYNLYLLIDDIEYKNEINNSIIEEIINANN